MLTVRLTGARENPKDIYPCFLVVGGKQQALVAEAAPEHAFPFLTPKGFHVVLERVCFHLGDDTNDPFLDGLGQAPKIFLCVFEELTHPRHV